jgi:hypothetical protein
LGTHFIVFGTYYCMFIEVGTYYCIVFFTVYCIVFTFYCIMYVLFYVYVLCCVVLLHSVPLSHAGQPWLECSRTWLPATTPIPPLSPFTGDVGCR